MPSLNEHRSPDVASPPGIMSKPDAASVPSVEDASATPDVMYSWRSVALDQWIAKQTNNGKIPLTMEMMLGCGHLDQYHYLGLDANDDIVRFLGCAPGGTFLDVGSGIGGPGRYIAWKTGCGIHGIDIQRDLVESANKVLSGIILLEPRFPPRTCTGRGTSVLGFTVGGSGFTGGGRFGRKPRRTPGHAVRSVTRISTTISSPVVHGG